MNKSKKEYCLCTGAFFTMITKTQARGIIKQLEKTHRYEMNCVSGLSYDAINHYYIEDKEIIIIIEIVNK